MYVIVGLAGTMMFKIVLGFPAEVIHEISEFEGGTHT